MLKGCDSLINAESGHYPAPLAISYCGTGVMMVSE